MIEYVALSFLFICFTIFVYIKIRHPFWNLQPVFHAYDYWRYAYSTPFLVYPFRPIKTKFYLPAHIRTLPYLDCSPEEKTSLLNLLQCYYIASDQILHTIDEPTLNAYLTGAGEPAMVSFRYAEFPKESPPLLAALVSRPVKITLLKSAQSRAQYPAYLIDYQTVQREQPATAMHRTLLQTHEYQQRILNPDIHVSLIKKEIELFDGVVPLVEYKTTTYVLQNKRFPPLPPHTHVTLVDTATMDLLVDFFYKTQNSASFQACIFADMGTLIALIKAQIFFVSCLRKGDQVYAYYFWKDAKTQYVLPDDFPGDTIQSMATVNQMDREDDPRGRLFYLGFLHALHHIIQQKPTFKILLLDEMADSVYLHSHWKAKHQPLHTHSSAYYTFNLICPCSPISPEKCLVLG